MNTFEKLVVILLGIIAASLLVIAGCLLYLALHVSVPQDNTGETQKPAASVVVCPQCPPCPQQVTASILPLPTPERQRKHHPIHNVTIEKALLIPVAVKTVPPAKTELPPKVETPRVAQAQSPPPPETPQIQVKRSDWVDCRKTVMIQSDCQLTEEQARHLIDKMGWHDITVTDVMSSDFLCQFYRQVCPDNNCLGRQPPSSP